MDAARRVKPLRATDPGRLGDYRLLGRLGSGGMGVVYLGEDRHRRLVAVKLVHAMLSGDGEFLGRFRSEINRARQVPAFCTAEVLAADLEHEPPYLVVEYVDGPSLAEVVDEGGPLSGATLGSVATGVATALAGIHGAGVIHRDLKPENVLLPPGTPKVIDFGIARALEATSRHTRTDQFVGTVAYMAPERFANEPGTELSAAADVFAWGCVIGYAGTGRTPFHGDTPTVTAARILTQPPYLDGLDRPLRRLVEHALAKDPADRPTAREVLDALAGTGQGRGSSPRHSARSPRQPVTAPASVPVSPAPAPMSPAFPAASAGVSGARAFPAVSAGVSGARAGISGAPVADRGRRRPRRTIIALAAGVLVLGAAAGVGLAAQQSPQPQSGTAVRPPTGGLAGGPAGTGVPSRGTRSAVPSRPVPTASKRARNPALLAQWVGPGANPCDLTGRALAVSATFDGSFPCGRGTTADDLTDQSVTIEAASTGGDACAGFWFHRNEKSGGDLVRICRDEISVEATRFGYTEPYGRVVVPDPPAADERFTTRVDIRGRKVTLTRGGKSLGTVTLTAESPRAGRSMLGMTTRDDRGGPPYTVEIYDADLVRS